MRALVIAFLISQAALADNKRERGKILLEVGVGTLVLTAVFAGLAGWGKSAACYHGEPNDDGCAIDIVVGTAGLIVTTPMTLSLLLAGGELCYQGRATAATTALGTVRF